MGADLIELELRLSKDLFEAYGPLISGRDLARTLGYKSLVSLRHAVHQKTVPVPTFTISNRRGHFALTLDVVSWLLQERNKASSNKVEINM
ncbi:MAG: hypothetical protein RPT25_09460 [Cycloclasticus sp.]